MAVLNAAQRRASQTLPGGRFPMPDEEHAKLALQMLPRAKNLTNAQRLAIQARANRMLGR